MKRHRGLGTIFWAGVLIAIGALLLLRNFGYSIPIWQTLAIYWPVLIIGWGLLKVVDYYRLRGEQRSLFSGGEVALLIFVLIVGCAFTAAAHITSDLGFIDINLAEDLDLFDILGENFEFTERLEAEAGAGGAVSIRNVYGSVVVEAGEPDRIVVDVTKTVRAGTREEAERLAPEMTFSIRDEGGVHRIESNRDELRSSLRRHFKSSLRVRVPAESRVDVDNRYGTVLVSGLTGDQRVVNKYGGSTLQNVVGDVRVDDGYGPVLVEDVSGRAELVNKYGSVTVARIGGGARIENKYGPVRASGIDGDASIVNKYSRVDVEDVRGDVHVEGRNNSVDIGAVSGGVDVETSYKDIVVRDAVGSIEIDNRHGDVRVSFESAPEQPISVRGEYTDVRIELPGDAGFSVDAQARSGSFESDFEGIDAVPAGRDQRIEGQYGEGGPRITIQNGRGDIRLVRRD